MSKEARAEKAQLKAELKAKKKAAKKNKNSWFRNLADAYKLVVSVFGWAKYLVIGLPILILIIGIVLAILTAHYFSWIFFGIIWALIAPLLVITLLVSQAAYRKMDGVPGAAGGVLSQMGRGWVTRDEPVQYTNDRKNFVFRAIGKAGVVLVAEGPGDLSSLVRAAAKQVNRTVSSAPVATIYVGHGAKQVPLKNLRRTIKRLPKKMTQQEVSETAQRLDSMASNALPIPKGIDPSRVHVSARARFR